MKNMSVKMAILVPALLVLALGIIVMVITVGTVSSSTTNDLTDRLMSARVNEYTNEFNALCMESYGKVAALSSVLENYAGTENAREEVMDLLSDVLMSDENMIGIWTCWEPNAFDGKDSQYAGMENHDNTGRYIPYVYKSGIGFKTEALMGYDVPGDGDYYLGAFNSGKPYITDPFEYTVEEKTITLYSIAIPIKVNGKTAGVVGIDINLESVVSLMNAASILDNGYVITISPSGVFATHPNKELLLENYDTVWMKSISSDINKILANGGDVSATAYSDVINANIRFLGSGVMIGDTGRYWVVCGIVPEKTATASSTALVWLVIGIGLALVIIVGAAIFIFINARLRDLPVMTAAAESIARGDINLSNLHSGTEQTKNEITLLGRAFASMANGIKEQAVIMGQIAQGDYSMTAPVRCETDVMNKAINDVIERTNQTMTEIQASTEQINTGSKQIADGAQALAQGSTEQAAAVEQLSSSIFEITQKTKANAAMAVNAANLGETIRGNAEKGSRQMNEMTQAVREINDASQNISKIIGVIDNIAFQTNILALNAAVEAARAGQHGKGFAVVAEEVRSLASKSADAARETGGMIQNSIEKAALGARIAEETAASLVEIVSGINESSRLVGEIAKSSEEQSEGIAQINKGIDQVAQVVQQNSATAEQSAASSEEMSGQANMLDELLTHFKLKDDEGNRRFQSIPAKSPKRQLVMPEKISYSPNVDSGDFGKY